MDNIAESQLQQERRNLWVNVLFNYLLDNKSSVLIPEKTTGAAIKAADHALKAFDKKFSPVKCKAKPEKAE